MKSVIYEVVRPGSAHNQLLSPVISYIAMAESDAATLHLPFDHAEVLDRLDAMYRLAQGQPGGGMAARFFQTGIAALFRETPALAQAIREAVPLGSCPTEPAHLELVLGGNELAVLPWELTGCPPGLGDADQSLALLTTHPVTITRALRAIRRLPTHVADTPRVLVVMSGFSGPNYLNVDTDAFAKAAYRAVEPWMPDDGDGRRATATSMVHVLPDPSLEELSQAIVGARDRPFTHLWIIAHGGSAPGRLRQEEPGLWLRKHGEEEGERVSAERLVRALKGTGCAPEFVALLSCFGAMPGSVVLPGASLAQELHRGGFPWVLSSQFPLSIDGAWRVTKSMLAGLLRGEDPRLLLHAVRRELCVAQAQGWDWASLVLFAAVPVDVDVRRAGDVARRLGPAIKNLLHRAEPYEDDPARAKGRAALGETLLRCVVTLETALSKGATQDLGQRHFAWMRVGAGRKRLADLDPDRRVEHLRKAEFAYQQAATDGHAPEWASVQVLSLQAVLRALKAGQRKDTDDAARWGAAFALAKAHAKDAGVPGAEGGGADWAKAEAHTTLLELWMLAAADRQRFCPTLSLRDACAGMKAAAEFLNKQAKDLDHGLLLKLTALQMKRLGRWGGEDADLRDALAAALSYALWALEPKDEDPAELLDPRAAKRAIGEHLDSGADSWADQLQKTLEGLPLATRLDPAIAWYVPWTQAKAVSPEGEPDPEQAKLAKLAKLKAAANAIRDLPPSNGDNWGVLAGRYAELARTDSGEAVVAWRKKALDAYVHGLLTTAGPAAQALDDLHYCLGGLITVADELGYGGVEELRAALRHVIDADRFVHEVGASRASFDTDAALQRSIEAWAASWPKVKDTWLDGTAFGVALASAKLPGDGVTAEELVVRLAGQKAWEIESTLNFAVSSELVRRERGEDPAERERVVRLFALLLDQDGPAKARWERVVAAFPPDRGADALRQEVSRLSGQRPPSPDAPTPETSAKARKGSRGKRS